MNGVSAWGLAAPRHPSDALKLNLFCSRARSETERRNFKINLSWYYFSRYRVYEASLGAPADSCSMGEKR